MDTGSYKGGYTAERATADELSYQVSLFRGPEVPVDIVDAVPDIVLLLNVHRQIVFAGRAVESIVSRREESLGLRPGELLGCVHADNDTGGCGTTKFCRVCGAAKAIVSAFVGRENLQECRILKNDGTALDLLVHAKLIRYRDYDFLVFTLQDIADQKRLHGMERLFFHDLLNAAGGIRNLLQVLPQLEPQEAVETQKLLHGLSQSMIETIQTQRDIKAAETGELVVHMRPSNLNNTMREVVDGFRSSSLHEKRRISYRGSGKEGRIVTDPRLLKRCVGVMIKNAVEATASGGEVTLGWEDESGTIKIWVHNPGTISPEVRLQIFQRSFSTKEGTRGIGTYSLKLMVEKYLRGRTWFSSNNEEGTYFYVRLPKEPDKKKPGDTQ
ncbi:MAG TPA: HAMP domain-containing histidine kinase [Sediminispirochaeta sp.]|nr:HAMP domain-containing histidine kinase [Sediminispirochaeta sp.]